MASILNAWPTATGADALSYAPAYIVKPTYTAIPPQFPASVPSEVVSEEQLPTSGAGNAASDASATASSEAVPSPGQIQAVIVPDTPMPENSVSALPSAPSYSGNKYILVDISDQYMYVYEGDVLVQTFIASTGMHNATKVGKFSVLDKIPNAYGSTWDIWMPNWLGIYYAGSTENGIHALPILPNGATLWEGFLGTPISYGCVVLGTYDSQWLYDWAEIGTPVEIRW
jgi:lipoprotein-anchoring transpeptidase ErfK/SrfK